MRRFVAAALFLGLTAAGCQAPSRRELHVGESPSETALRALAPAQGLEKEGRTREAFAAYHQIVRQFADTPAGKNAAARIVKAQRDATRKPSRRKSALGASKGSG